MLDAPEFLVRLPPSTQSVRPSLSHPSYAPCPPSDFATSKEVLASVDPIQLLSKPLLVVLPKRDRPAILHPTSSQSTVSTWSAIQDGQSSCARLVTTNSNVFRIIRASSRKTEHLQYAVVDSCEILFGHGCEVVNLSINSETSTSVKPRSYIHPQQADDELGPIGMDRPEHRRQRFERPGCDGRDLIPTVESNPFKICWRPAPAVAYAQYISFPQACEVLSDLDDQLYEGRRISVTHHLSRRPSTSPNFSLRAEGWPTNVPLEDVQRMMRTQEVQLSNPFQPSRVEAGMRLVEKFIEETVRLCAVQWHWRGALLEATVLDLKPVDALLLKQRIRDFRHPTIGQNPLSTSYTFIIRYPVETVVFLSIKRKIEDLRHRYLTTRSTVRVNWQERFGDFNQAGLTQLSLQGEIGDELTKAKLELDIILDGELFLVNGRPFWHCFFNSVQSKPFLHSVALEMGVVVACDARKQTLHLYGSSTKRQEARRAIINQLEIESQQVVINLHNRSYNYMLNSGIARLQRQFGYESVFLEPSTGRLFVRGKHGVVQQARRMVHNSIHSQCDPETIAGMCLICMDAVKEPFILDCGHCYCKECLRLYTSSASESGNFPITCLSGQGEMECKAKIPIIILRSILLPEEQSGLWRSAFFSFIRRHPKEYQFCPTNGCHQIYRVSEEVGSPPMQCNSCLAFVCRHCCCNYHIGVTCKQHQDASDRLFARWESEHDVKRCPGCKRAIERSDGCNHMTCTSCGTHMCWQCMQSFESGGKVYEHMFLAHGGIYPRNLTSE